MSYTLTPADVVEIRERAAHESMAALSARFGVNPQTIGKILNGHRWGWVVTGEETTRRHPSTRRLPLAPIEEVLVGRLHITAREQANACGVSRRTVMRWRRAGTISLTCADLIAERLGYHPCELWPDWSTT